MFNQLQLNTFNNISKRNLNILKPNRYIYNIEIN